MKKKEKSAHCITVFLMVCFPHVIPRARHFPLKKEKNENYHSHR